MKDNDSSSKNNKTDPRPDQVTEVANEKESENVRQGVQTVEKLKLRLRNIEDLLHRVFKGLRIVKGELVGKGD